MDSITTLEGTVKAFAGQGRKLGYPTANIEVNPGTAEGLFVGYTKLQGQQWASIIFIGVPVTLGQNVKRAEAHLLDFPDRDLYGENINVSAVKKLRNNRKFGSVEELKAQMQKDEKAARKYFKEVSSK